MLSNNLRNIEEEIRLSSAKIGRNPQEITIVAVTKGVGLDKIKEALDSCIKDFGENRVQEAFSKYHQLDKQLYKLHMIGHLQTNKVKKAVEFFDMIQSVDTLKLAQEIDRYSQGANKVTDVLLQVNTSAEATKFGIKPDETLDFIKKAQDFKNIKIKGLMTIAPLVDNPEKTRPYFSLLRELKDKINKFSNQQLTVLSMGMSDDYKIAVEEGATMIRIGRSLFDEKSLFDK